MVVAAPWHNKDIGLTFTAKERKPLLVAGTISEQPDFLLEWQAAKSDIDFPDGEYRENSPTRLENLRCRSGVALHSHRVRLGTRHPDTSKREENASSSASSMGKPLRKYIITCVPSDLSGPWE